MSQATESNAVRFAAFSIRHSDTDTHSISRAKAAVRQSQTTSPRQPNTLIAPNKRSATPACSSPSYHFVNDNARMTKFIATTGGRTA